MSIAGNKVPARPQPATGITLTQYAVLVAAGAFATTFAQQRVLANLPTTFLLKDHLHLNKEAVSVFFFWATIGWNLKPLAGILADAFPLFGTLVWLNAATTAAVLLFVFFLPRAIVNRREGDSVLPATVPTPPEHNIAV